ncbi:leukotriene B4 receptor 1-like [Mercenaria mercenaria]|uniref:leukotriene B4 receptor 1-like n=1 Tax=Mercenaria mercenaria TaxID=6596 RepID=UPI00234FA9F7|nr:leukotriene B4 receptor 1-like [Mercenaria mercenaria]
MALFSDNLTMADVNLTDFFPNDVELNTTNSTVSPPKQSFAELQNSFYVASYVLTPIFLVIGLFGNGVTIFTMASKSFSNMTSRYILIALALSDTTLLLTQPFNKLFLRKLIGYDVRAMSDIGCKAFFHIFKTGKMTSSWLIVILCFERFVAVVFPFKTKTIITKKSILALIAIDYIFIVTYNGVWTFSSIIVDGTCKPDVTYPETKEKYRDFLLAGSSFYSLIPMIIMAILTPVIVIKLLLQRRKRKHLAGAAGDKADSETIRISAMLIGIVVAYVALVLPITIVHNLAFWRNVSAFDVNTRGFFILREVAQIFEQLNYSINFFLYVLCSSKFRGRVIELLGLSKCVERARAQSTSSKTRSTTANRTARPLENVESGASVSKNTNGEKETKTTQNHIRS